MFRNYRWAPIAHTLRLVWCVATLWVLASAGVAQGNSDSIRIDTARFQPRNGQFLALPLVYYTPETRLAFGASGIYFFRVENDSLNKLSSVQLFGAYTTRKQILFWLPYQVFLKENKYWLSGQVGFFKYPYVFNGIGNEVPNDFEEDYTASFPRFRINALRRVLPNWYAGIRYWFQRTSIIETEEGKLLETGLVPGGDGSRISGVGLVLNYDSRDNLQFPYKGLFVRLANLSFSDWTGSNTTYDNYLLDARVYQRVWKKHILAVQGMANFNYGNPPFNQMAMLGGPDVMRGYRQGRYRDKKMMAFQAEYRSPFWHRFGIAVFGGYGAVGEDVDDFRVADMRASYGAGIRFLFSEAERLNMRVDFGYGDNGNSGVYFTFGEAF